MVRDTSEIPVSISHADHHRREVCRRLQHPHSVLRGQSLAASQLVQLIRVGRPPAWIVPDVDGLALEVESEFLLDGVYPLELPEQDRLADSLRDALRSRLDDGGVLSLREDDPLRLLLGDVDHPAHDGPSQTEASLEFLPVSPDIELLRRYPCDALVDRSLSDRTGLPD